MKRPESIIQEQFEGIANIFGLLLCFLGKELLAIRLHLNISFSHCLSNFLSKDLTPIT